MPNDYEIFFFPPDCTHEQTKDSIPARVKCWIRNERNYVGTVSLGCRAVHRLGIKNYLTHSRGNVTFNQER